MKYKYLSTIFLLTTIFLVGTKSSFAQFADVPETHPNYAAINYVQTQGIVSGYQDGSYKPENKVTRAEFTKIVMNSMYSEAIADACDQGLFNFVDVDQDTQSKFGKYICLAKSDGRIGGYSDGTYKPHNNITFGESAKLITGGIPFSINRDYDAIASLDDVFGVYVNNLYQADAIPVTIKDIRTYNITRGELAEMIYRMSVSGQWISKKFEFFTTDVISGFSTAEVNIESTSSSRYKLTTLLGQEYTIADRHIVFVAKSANPGDYVNSIVQLQNGLSGYDVRLTLVLNTDTNQIIAIYGSPNSLPVQ